MKLHITAFVVSIFLAIPFIYQAAKFISSCIVFNCSNQDRESAEMGLMIFGAIGFPSLISAVCYSVIFYKSGKKKDA